MSASYNPDESGPVKADKVNYICADCGQKNNIQMREVIRCRSCGHRVMYKERTKKMVQFLAV
ncbi:DNA directed RNA polymerase [Protomyces lactucae-debilis]|uniref:DNA directed RNA polymerase n=1 Tax=Protomyces lactucae-debilis TaxID=2754530 RepID=A0A1Y2FUR4_PROLT|nr:DNA directed RNA polymerase [Protomyces lactucae-debilis]ORY87732.1 DNA directed RNA polymerase [Protomyces lactucae-debilis]